MVINTEANKEETLNLKNTLSEILNEEFLGSFRKGNVRNSEFLSSVQKRGTKFYIKCLMPKIGKVVSNYVPYI